MRKNILGLYAFAGVLSGCVMRQPIVYHDEITQTNNVGEVEKTMAVYAYNDNQFTPLGNIWNMGTYGVLGAGIGLYKYPKEGFCNPETNSTAKKIFDGTMGIITGPFRGCYQGMNYGYNLEYDKGRSVEGLIFDGIEHGAIKTGNFIRDLGR